MVRRHIKIELASGDICLARQSHLSTLGTVCVSLAITMVYTLKTSKQNLVDSSTEETKAPQSLDVAKAAPGMRTITWRDHLMSVVESSSVMVSASRMSSFNSNCSCNAAAMASSSSSVSLSPLLPGFPPRSNSRSAHQQEHLLLAIA